MKSNRVAAYKMLTVLLQCVPAGGYLQLFSSKPCSYLALGF